MNCGSQVSIRQDPSGNIIITVDGTSFDIGPRTNIPEVACAVDGSGVYIDDVLCVFPEGGNVSGLALTNEEDVGGLLTLSQTNGPDLSVPAVNTFEWDGVSEVPPMLAVYDPEGRLNAFSNIDNGNEEAGPYPVVVSFDLSYPAIPFKVAQRNELGNIQVGRATDPNDALSVVEAQQRFVSFPPFEVPGVIINTTSGIEIRRPELGEMTGGPLPGFGTYFVGYDGSTGDPILLNADTGVNPLSVPLRDDNGHFQVAYPTSSLHPASKLYVDLKLPNGASGQPLIWDAALNAGAGGWASGYLKRGSIEGAPIVPGNGVLLGAAAGAAPGDPIRVMNVTRNADANTVVARDINGNFRAAAGSAATDVIIKQQLDARLSPNARLAIDALTPLDGAATLAEVITKVNAIIAALKATGG